METKSNHKNRQGSFRAKIYCICPECGVKIPHRRGIPCQNEKCPDCGNEMFREGSFHHKQWMKKQKAKEEIS